MPTDFDRSQSLLKILAEKYKNVKKLDCFTDHNNQNQWMYQIQQICESESMDFFKIMYFIKRSIKNSNK